MSHTIDWRSRPALRKMSGNAAKLLLVYLTFLDTETNLAWPKTATLKWFTDIGYKQVVNARKELVDLQIIERANYHEIPEQYRDPQHPKYKAEHYVPPQRWIARIKTEANVDGATVPLFYNPRFNSWYADAHDGDDPDETLDETETPQDPHEQTTVSQGNSSQGNISQGNVSQGHSDIYLYPIEEHDSTEGENHLLPTHTSEDSVHSKESQMKTMIGLLRFPGVRVLTTKQKDIVKACLFKMQRWFLVPDTTMLQHYMIWQIAVDWHDDIFPGKRLFEEGGFFPEFAKQYNAEMKHLLTRCAANFDDWFVRVTAEPQALRQDMQQFYLKIKEEYLQQQAKQQTEDFTQFIER